MYKAFSIVPGTLTAIIIGFNITISVRISISVNSVNINSSLSITKKIIFGPAEIESKQRDFTKPHQGDSSGGSCFS